MRAASLPILISRGLHSEMLATHLPLMFQAPDRLIGHVARANPHWHSFDPDYESLAIFSAVDGYISPSLYASKKIDGKVVPTWNYQAVHATGRIEIIENKKELMGIVTCLTERFESKRAEPWAVHDAPTDYMAAQLKGIVGIMLHITRLEGKAKLSQNKSTEDINGVIAGLANENPALAATMKNAVK